MDLRADRVELEKVFKKMRENANNWIEMVRKKEKEVIGIIAPIEEGLKKEKERIDREEEEEKRRILEEKQNRLQKRIDELISYGSQYSIIEIEAMSEEEFRQCANAAKVGWENMKILQKMKEEEELKIQAQIEKDRQELEEARKKIQELEERRIREENAAHLAQVAKEAAEKATKETEERIKREQEAKIEAERLQKIKEEEDRKAELQKQENRERYISFLKSHGYNNETKDQFEVDTKSIEGKIILKKIV